MNTCGFHIQKTRGRASRILVCSSDRAVKSDSTLNFLLVVFSLHTVEIHRRVSKVDVFSHGHVLFFLLTGQQPFANFFKSAIPSFGMGGGLPEITDKEMVNSTHPFDMCWTFDPKKCPGD